MTENASTLFCNFHHFECIEYDRELNDALYFPLVATPESHMRMTERNSGQFQATITKDFKVGPAAEVLVCDL